MSRRRAKLYVITRQKKNDMTSHQSVRKVLSMLVSSHCCPLWNTPETYEKVLGARCSDRPHEISLIVLALRYEIVSEMFRLRHRLISVILLPKLTNWLMRQSNLAHFEAKWAVDSWAMALGLLPFAEEELSNLAPTE